MGQDVTNNSRDEVLGLLSGRRGERRPCFSGLISITEPGLQSLGLHFGEIHTDPVKMAAAAATSYRLFGLESAVVPTDICVEAGALGAEVDFRIDSPRPEFPTVVKPLATSLGDLHIPSPVSVVRHERVATVIEAIGLLKADVGQEVAVGAWVPGPATLAMYLVDRGGVLSDLMSAPGEAAGSLDGLADVLAEVALAYRAAGADFITIHEMGGSPGMLGPALFGRVVQPPLKRLIAALPAPRVLSACGRTNRGMKLLFECGAEALNVDQANNLAQSRAALGQEAILFGNIDPVGTLAEGDEAAVREAVRGAIDEGADAVWPGCDLWPRVPAANVRAMVDEAAGYRSMPGSRETT